MVIPRAYFRVTRKSIFSCLLSLSILLVLSSYYHHQSIPSTSSSSSSSFFFVHSSSSQEVDMNGFPQINLKKKRNQNSKESAVAKAIPPTHLFSSENRRIEYGFVEENRKNVAIITKNKKTHLADIMFPNQRNSYKRSSDTKEKIYPILKQLNVGPEKDKLNNNAYTRRSDNQVVAGTEKKYISEISEASATSSAKSITWTQNGVPISKQSATTSSKRDSSSNEYKYRYKSIINKTRKSKLSWPSDSECKKFRVFFAKIQALPPCALASYPGSGNTWTRRLLEDSSGLFTGSIYTDQQLYVNGYYGELESWTSGTTIAQKTHDCGPHHVEAFNRSAILLIRNPYRSILSFHNYIFAGHTGFAPMSNYRRKDWSKFVHLQAKAWLEMAINWTTQSDPRSLTVLHYEHLQKNPVPDMERVLRNLGFQPDPDRMRCLQKAHSYKTFKRKEEFVPEKLEMFRKADRDKIDRAIRYVDYLLRKRDQPPLPIHLYEFYNGTTSTHITRIPCLKSETEGECDQRVDTLNSVRKGRGPDFDEERTKRRRNRDR